MCGALMAVCLGKRTLKLSEDDGMCDGITDYERLGVFAVLWLLLNV